MDNTAIEINRLPLEIKTTLFVLQQLFSDEYILSGSIADYLNICKQTEYFVPHDVDITITPQQLKVLQKHYFLRKVEGIYRQNVIDEYYTFIYGCNVDIFVKKQPIKEKTVLYDKGCWKIRHQSSDERKQQHSKALTLPISDHRKRKHQKRLTFYRLYENNI